MVLPGALALCLILCSCSKPDENVNRPSPKTSAEQPFKVKTATGVAMIYLPGGEFVMGTDRESPDERPAHKVRLQSFLMDKFEVYQELFVIAQLPNPSHWHDNPKKPVEQIRWRDAKLYCNERSLMEGLDPCYDEEKAGLPCDFSKNGYRLPTEAEWEYAARTGTTGAYDIGQANNLKQYAWFDQNAQKKTYPVGVKKPNRWGLHDMYGNVSEWCQDVYDVDAYLNSVAVDPTGPAEPDGNSKRVMRGGSWKSSAAMCRVTFRQGQQTGDSDACFFTDYCGFRCVRRIEAAGARKLLPTVP